MVPASAVPVKVGVVSLVMLSPSTPLSEVGLSTGADGAGGTIVSIMTDNAAERTLLFPATSTCDALMLCVPSVSTAEVMV